MKKIDKIKREKEMKNKEEQNKRAHSKRAQITIFIIIAILIVAAIVLAVYFYPQIKTRFFVGFEPNSYLTSCIEKDLNSAKNEVIKQGGSINPENYVLYENNKVEYLCYTNESYATCVMQQPMLLQHVESEIERKIDARVKTCAENLRAEFERNGYSISAGQLKYIVLIVPKKIVLQLNYPITATKEGTKTYKEFTAESKSGLYDLIMIATSILNFEARYGEASSDIYMTYYPSMKVEKKEISEKGTVYILTDRESQEAFYFASKSLPWPQGYS